MSETPAVSIYESTFAPSDKTDAILVVGEKKLHVNKSLLSYHSDFFKTLFNGEFKEKSMQEIPIEDVNFEDFATLLSFIQQSPIAMKNDLEKFENLLKLADRFLMPAARHHLELLIGLTNMDKFEKLELAGRYECRILLSHVLNTFRCRDDYKDMFKICKEFSAMTKSIIFDDFFFKVGYHFI